MNTIQLECFIAVAEHLNFSRASEALKISQPAVSYQIQTLEEELEVKLFRRTSKNVSFTPAGIQFLPDAELILKTSFSAKERLGRQEHFLSFETGCHNYLELNLLPPVFRRLTQEFPLLHPSVRVIPFPSMLELVENKKIQAAFQIRENHRKSSLYFKKLCSAKISCVLPPEHPLTQFQALTVEMLTGNLICISPRQIPGEIFAAQSKIASHLTPEQQYHVENTESAVTLTKSGLGYSLCADVPGTRDPGLVYRPLEDLPSLSFGICYRYDERHPVLKRFLTLCQSCMEENKA